MDVNSYAVRVVPLPPEEGGGWFADVPDLPGCEAKGETLEEAIEQVRNVIQSLAAAARKFGIKLSPPTWDGESEPMVSEPVKWYQPEDPTPRHQCPCCDYVTLPERGTFLICPICYWEDDGTDVDHLDSTSLPNRMTLREGRINFKRLGACEEAMLQHVLPIGERASFEYRPRDMPE